MTTRDNGERQTYHSGSGDRCGACGWGLYAHECPSAERAARDGGGLREEAWGVWWREHARGAHGCACKYDPMEDGGFQPHHVGLGIAAPAPALDAALDDAAWRAIRSALQIARQGPESPEQRFVAALETFGFRVQETDEHAAAQEDGHE